MFVQDLHQIMTEFRHGFRAKASLLLTQNAPAVNYNTTRLCWIVVTQWDYHIHSDAIRALSRIFFMYFLLSDGVGNETSACNLDSKYIGYPAISDTLFLQIFIFFNSRWCAQSKFSSNIYIDNVKLESCHMPAANDLYTSTSTHTTTSSNTALDGI